jgi:hypothetical protein
MLRFTGREVKDGLAALREKRNPDFPAEPKDFEGLLRMGWNTCSAWPIATAASGAIGNFSLRTCQHWSGARVDRCSAEKI